MRIRTILLVGAVLLGGVALAGSATAAHPDGQPLNETTNDTDSPDVGVCMIGVESPCNGEQWDGDNETGANETDGEPLQPVDGGNETGEAGICLVGTDSPCNGEQTDGGTLEPVTDENRTEEHIEPVKDTGEAGICLIGADSPCNDGGSVEMTSHESRSLFDSVLRVLSVLF